MKYHVKLSPGNDVITAGWLSDDGEVLPPLTEVTEAVYHKILDRAQGEWIGDGSKELRWNYDGSDVTENPDTRPTGTWSTTLIEAQEGDTITDAILTVSDTGWNGPMVLSFAGRRAGVTFTNGQARIAVNTSLTATEPTRDYSFGQCAEVRLTNKLRIIVAPTDLRGRE